MHFLSSRPILASLSIAVLAGCGQALPPESPGRFTHLTIEGDAPSFRAEVARESDGRVVATCTHPPCDLPIDSGHYELRVIGAWTTPDLSRGIEVRSAGTRVEVRTGSTVERGLGLVLGVGGLVMMGTGWLTGYCMDSAPRGTPVSWSCSGGPALLIFSGMLVTAVGWVIFGTSGTKLGVVQSPPRRTSGGGALFTF